MQQNGATVIAPNSRIEKQLCQAGYDGDLELVKNLTLCEFDLNLSDYDKRTIGHLAACEGHTDMLIYLSVATSFDFYFKDRFGKSTLDEITD